MLRTKAIYAIGILCGIMCWVDWLPGLSLAIVGATKNIVFITFIGVMMLSSKDKLLALSRSSLALLGFYVLTFALSLIHGVKLAPYYNNYVILAVFLSCNPKRDLALVDGYITGGVLTIIYMAMIGSGFFHLGSDTIRNLESAGLPPWVFRDSYEVARMGLTTKYNKLAYMFAVGIFFLSKRVKRHRWPFYMLFSLTLIATGGRGGVVVMAAYLLLMNFRNGLVLGAVVAFLYAGFIGVATDIRVFNFNNDSSQLRLEQVAVALQTENPWIGDNGFTLAHEEYGFSHVHNFFLNTYFNGGIIALLAGVILIIYLIWRFKNLTWSVKAFFFSLLFAQLSFENFNMVLALSAYIPVWYYLLYVDLYESTLRVEKF